MLKKVNYPKIKKICSIFDFAIVSGVQKSLELY